MKLFINEGVCKRKWNGNVKMKDICPSNLELSIPNYLKSQQRQECIRIILPDITERELTNDVLLDQVTLKRTSKNTYCFERLEKDRESHMYALLRSTECVPDDIFIPASMKDRVKVIKRIRFIDDEVDYGDFLSNVYLIKIKLDIGESLPVYMTHAKPQVMGEFYVFYNSTWDEGYNVTKKFKTLILLNKRNKDEYISLSSLCE